MKILYFCGMEQNLLQKNIAYLKGVGPKKAEILQKELGRVTYTPAKSRKKSRILLAFVFYPQNHHIFLGL